MKGFSHFYCFAALICSLLIFCSTANAQQQANSQAQQTKAQEQQAKEQQQDPDVQYGAQLLKPGSVAPEFRLKGPDGKELALSDFRGK